VQISSTNLLIAGQFAPRAPATSATPKPQDVEAQFAPLDFKRVASAAAAPASEKPVVAQSAQTLGANLDIRV